VSGALTIGPAYGAMSMVKGCGLRGDGKLQQAKSLQRYQELSAGTGEYFTVSVSINSQARHALAP
jgi:hypothetical protein